MITQYFNGEIVRHPDMKAIRVRTIQKREKNKICSFGVPEDLCKTFQKWQLLNPKERLNTKGFKQVYNGIEFVSVEIQNCSRCPLSNVYKSEIDKDGFEWKEYICPRAQKRYISQIKPKKFTIDYKVYRKLSSAAHYIIKESKNKTLFITLTFGKYINKEINGKQANECFSKFMENLRENYGVEHYLSVRERGEDNNRLHYHLVLSCPFISFVNLNNAWCHATSEYCQYSKNAVQSDGSNKIIRSPARAVRYVCKYISKNIKNKVENNNPDIRSRCYFISNCTISSLYVDENTGEISRQSNLKKTITNRQLNIIDYLKDYKGIYIMQYEYVTVFKITDLKEFQRFSNNVIYPVFNCINKSNGLRHNPDFKT